MMKTPVLWIENLIVITDLKIQLLMRTLHQMMCSRHLSTQIIEPLKTIYLYQEPHVHTNNRATEAHTSLPSQQPIAKDAYIQSSTHEDKDDTGTNLPCDTTRTNMRTQRVKAPNVNRSELSPVYLISLRNKGRVVAKGKLVATDSKRLIGGTMLGKEYVVVFVGSLENIANGDEELPRPLYDVNNATSSIQT
uniref:Transposase Tnp1/En/Spm-like domain-containing protein n=1 Tax=Arundo donax TaxID=35708 RepID=A0A0A9CVV4_ARUDO